MYTHSGKPNTRIDVADILRGIAIGGIILIHFIEHMNFYQFPDASSPFWAKMNQGIWDTIFAMLFGLSFYIQHDNQAQKGIDFRPRFVWRMILLMLFGLFDLLFYKTKAQKWLIRIAPFGKMSLTNYLGQSMIGGVIFYNWGFGLYSHCGHTASFCLGICCIIILYTFCNWWLKSHRRGPFEELWSRATWIGKR